MRKTYAEIIAEKYAGAEVEIYIGDDTGSLHYSDHDVSQKSVIRGVVKSATDECLTLEIKLVTPLVTHVTELDLHEWCIKGVMRKQDNGVGILNIFGNQEVRRMKR